jgi:hypothetical protein
MKTNNILIHAISEVVNINIVLFLFTASCISSDDYQWSGNTQFIHHLLKKKPRPYSLKHWHSPIGMRGVNIPKTTGCTWFIENLSPSDLIISAHWTIPKAVTWLTQVVADLSPRSPWFLISVTKVSKEPPDSVFKLDVGNLRSPRPPRIVGNNLRDCMLLKTNDYALTVSVQIM